MNIVAYLIGKGHTFDYIFSLDTYEQLIVLATMEVERERELEKWQLLKK